jgi:hypothetical protein
VGAKASPIDVIEYFKKRVKDVEKIALNSEQGVGNRQLLKI